MSEVIRIFVEKKDGFNVLAKQTLWDIRHNLGMKSVEDLRYIVRYDLEGLTKEEYDKAKTIVLSEPNADVIYEETLPVEDGWKVFAMEYLPVSTISAATLPSSAFSFLLRVSVARFLQQE